MGPENLTQHKYFQRIFNYCIIGHQVFSKSVKLTSNSLPSEHYNRFHQHKPIISGGVTVFLTLLSLVVLIINQKRRKSGFKIRVKVIRREQMKEFQYIKGHRT